MIEAEYLLFLGTSTRLDGLKLPTLRRRHKMDLAKHAKTDLCQKANRKMIIAALLITIQMVLLFWTNMKDIRQPKPQVKQ